MKTIFINAAGGQEKINKALEISKLVFNEDELIPIRFDSSISLHENVELLLGCDYYFAIDGVWCLKDAGRDRDRLNMIARNLLGNAKLFYIDRAQFYTDDEWNEVVERHDCCEDGENVVEAGY